MSEPLDAAVADATPTLKDRMLGKAFELRGWIKWIVYALLLINLGYYAWEEWVIAAHTLRDGGTFLDWTAAYAATLEELAWFLLLALFELETHAIPDEALTPRVERTLHLFRIAGSILLAHSLYQYVLNVADLERKVAVLPGVSSLCDLAGHDVSFASNMKYTIIDSQNCVELSDDTVFYRMVVESVVTDARGLTIEKQLGWVDVFELSVWLLIILSIEIAVRLQNRDIVSGPLLRATNASKVLLYGALFLAMAYWAYRSQWVYVWDEFVWIAGFFVIEMNVMEWRDELVEEEA